MLQKVITTLKHQDSPTPSQTCMMREREEESWALYKQVEVGEGCDMHICPFVFIIALNLAPYSLTFWGNTAETLCEQNSVR